MSVESARFLVAPGILFSDEFLKMNVPNDVMKSIDLTGAYVFHTTEPIPCTLFCFGIGLSSADGDGPIVRFRSVARSEAEQQWAYNFSTSIDPHNKFNLRSFSYHIDLTHTTLIRKPTDEEVATIHIKFRNSKSNSTSQQKMQRELRALDRRRLHEAGVQPPADRPLPSVEPRHITIKRGVLYEKYHSDSSDEYEGEDEYDTSQRLLPTTQELLFDDEKDIPWGNLDIDIDEGGASKHIINQSDNDFSGSKVTSQKFSRKLTRRPPKTPLELVLRSMQARSQRSRQRILED
jgi:hypothetical protein